MKKSHFWPSSSAPEGSSRRTLTSALRVLNVLALVVLVGGVYFSSAPGSNAADLLAPAAAGTAEPGIPLFSESFSNQDAAASGIGVLNYTGQTGMTYDADAAYRPTGGQCDGWVMSSLTPQPTAAQDTGCANNQPVGWAQLQKMAIDLGTAQGMNATDAAKNQVLTEYTNATNGSIAAGYELKTKSTITAEPGHYYAVSAYFAEVNCGLAASTHAKMTFSLVVNGVVKDLSTNLDPCTAPGWVKYSEARVVKLQSAAIQMPATGAATLGFQLYNASTTGSGNDVSFDLPQIVDVTPSLDKAFTPSTIVKGETSKLTFTVTNTDDLAAKSDWSFTDKLPAGMTLADSTFGGNCTDLTGAVFNVAGTTGGDTITVTGGDLAQGSTSCTITATVTTNASGTFVNGPANVTTTLVPPEDTLLVVVPPVAKLDLDKRVVAPNGVVDVNSNGVTDAGDTIAYEFQLTNNGNVSLTSTSATDPKLAAAGITISCPVSTLAPGASTLCTASAPYVVTQTDVDAGSVLNTATGHGTPPPGVTPIVPPTDSTVTPTGSLAGIDLVKTADKAAVVSGQTITYTFTATNTGQVSLSNVVISEGAFTGSGTMSPLTCTPGQPARLAPTKKLVCTATYVATQTDVDAGSVKNTASVVGTPPTGPNVTDTDTVTIPATRSASLLLDKRVVSPDGVVDLNSNGVTDAGDTIAYEFELSNDGNVTLTSVSATDPKLAAAGITISCPVTTLAPGASTTCTASAPYAVTQGDVDAGGVTNVATGHGTPPTGVVKIVPPADTTVTPTDETASIDLVKTADKATLVAGQTVTYSFTATNTGNVSLSNVVISEGAFTGSGTMSPLTCTPGQPATLAPTKKLVCTATYVVTQADLNVGSVKNTADVVGTPPTGPNVTDTDTVTVPGTRAASLGLDKRVVSPDGVVDVNDDDVTDAGDTIVYEFELTNTGNVTLTGVSATDPKLAAAGITVSCPVATLAPGDSTVCTASAPYQITQADVDAGAVTNVATGHGTPPTGVTPPSEPTDTTVTPTELRSGLVLDKRVAKVTDVNDNGFTDAGDEIDYEFGLLNNGTVTVSDLTVADPLVGAVTCPVASLAPGGSTVCTADSAYVITQADVDAGNVHNRATASADAPCAGQGGGGSGGNSRVGAPGASLTTTTCVVDSNPDTTDTPTSRRPAVTFDKQVSKTKDLNGNGYLDVNDEIYYAFLVKNTGNVTVTGLVVEDDLLTRNHITVTCTPDTLAPGESVLCTASAPYKITQADVARHVVVNAAMVHVGVPPGVPAVDPPGDHTDTPVGGPIVDPPTTGDDSQGTNGILPETGLSPLALLAGIAGLLLIVAGAGAVLSAARPRPKHSR